MIWWAWDSLDGWIEWLTTRSPELMKFFSDFEANTNNNAPNWLTVMITKHPMMKIRYLWLVAHNCFLILICSSKITLGSGSDPLPLPSNIFRNPSILSICSSHVTRNSTHTSKNTPVRYTHDTKAAKNMIEFHGTCTVTCGTDTDTIEKKRILWASSTAKEGRRM